MTKAKEKKISGFKAFNKDMTCNGYQYEVGKTYTHKGDINLCVCGFHSCENPLDILSYYDLCDSRFCAVSSSGEIKKDADSSKLCSAKIKIEVELMLSEYINKAVTWLIDFCKTSINKKIKDSAQLAASGYFAKLAASGDSAQLAASGYFAKLAASGDSAKLAASGDSAKLAASGDFAKLAASGDSAKLAASGDSAQLAASGYSSIIANTGLYGKAKAGKNGTIVLTRWVKDEQRHRVSVGYVGENIKADTWYKLDDNGNFMEV